MLPASLASPSPNARQARPPSTWMQCGIAPSWCAWRCSLQGQPATQNTTISEAQIGLQKRYPNPASSFQLNRKRYISGNMKPKTGFKKRPRKCFEKPPKESCISWARYGFKLPSTARLFSTQVRDLRSWRPCGCFDALETVSS